MSDVQKNQAGTEVEENEVLRAARESRAQKEAADASEEALKNDGNKRALGWKAAAGIGVGSAAVLAALLFANRSKK
ncbi:hypothetical protein [Sphingopyxis yananensis]|jgi:hypothetical protein|uniref:hypothetical protein n=1 Tax=Sphingopyxis yananensis TaxID=2886687 RepID=UPI001D0F4BCB|nr:hypothetical protein [Sphingopyxis yananensis]MCC2602807.1 hypothetical protein [Sphingopyxis yananensis]